MHSITEKNMDWDSLLNSPEPVFWNLVFDKGRLKTFVSWFFKKYGEKKTLVLLEQLKEVGFGYATNAGISLGIEDLKIPEQKNQLLAKAEMTIQKSNFLYRQGRLTGIEKMQKFIETWHETSETLKEAVVRNFEKTDILNPVYMMAFSGARGNMSQVRQLVGMRGLMSDPQGKIIDFPIQSNFREGLTLTEYLISTYGARKGIVDTALRTATAGYLTRRLVDVAQHVIVSKFDCGTQRGIFLFDMKEGSQTLYSFQNRLIGRVLAQDICSGEQKDKSVDLSKFGSEKNILNHSSFNIDLNSRGFSNKLEKSKKVTAFRNQEVTFELALTISKLTKKALVRSPLTCENRKLVCQLCYGWSLATSRLVSIGEAVGVIAGQSIGEPGTQLTMRTFHTGGVFSAGVTQQINAPFSGFIEYGEPIAGTCVRTPHGQLAFLTKTYGTMFLKKSSSEPESQTYKLPAFTILFGRHGQLIKEHELIAQISALPVTVQTTQTIEQTIYSTFEGEVYYDELDLLEDVDERYGERISTSEDWAKVWILAGKIYNPAFQSSFLPCSGDFLQKKTIVNQIRWASSSLLTSQNMGIRLSPPTDEVRPTFQALRYFSTTDLEKETLGVVRGTLVKPLKTNIAAEHPLLLAKTKNEKKKSVSVQEYTFQELTPRFHIRSVYSLKDSFRTWAKARIWTYGSTNISEFPASTETKILKTLLTDSIYVYQQMKKLQILTSQVPISFQRIAPGTLHKFLKFVSNKKSVIAQRTRAGAQAGLRRLGRPTDEVRERSSASRPTKSASFATAQRDSLQLRLEPQVRLRNLNSLFNLNQSEESAFLHPLILMNYIPSVVQVKTLRNYFKLFKTSTFMSLSSVFNSYSQSSNLGFLSYRSRFYLSFLKDNQKKSNELYSNVIYQQAKSSKFSYSTKTLKSLRKKTLSLNLSKIKNLSRSNLSINSFKVIKPKEFLNPLKLEKLTLKRPIISLPIKDVSYSKLGYIISLGSKNERFFAFSSLTKNANRSFLTLRSKSFESFSVNSKNLNKNKITPSKNSNAWKPWSVQTDLHWFPESDLRQFSGILLFKSPKLYKRLFKQTLMNSNLKSGKPFVTGLDLKTTLKNFDLSNSQVQKKYSLKANLELNFSNHFVFSKKFKVRNNLDTSMAKILYFNRFRSHFDDLTLFSSRNEIKRSSAKGRISSLRQSFFLFQKAAFTVQNQTSFKNPKKLADIRQLLLSLSRKQVKTIQNPFLKTEEVAKVQTSFSELEWLPQENYRLHCFTKQKLLNDFNESKIFFTTNNSLKNQNRKNLLLYLTNLQGKKKPFSFKYEGYLTQSWPMSPQAQLRAALGRRSPKKESSDLTQVQITRHSHSPELNTNFLVDFCNNGPPVQLRTSLAKLGTSFASPAKTFDLGSKKHSNIKPTQYFQPSRASINGKKTAKFGFELRCQETKDPSLLTESLKFSFLNYLESKVLNTNGRKKPLVKHINTFYASFQKDLLQNFFTFIPLIKDQKSKPLQKSIEENFKNQKYSSSTRASASRPRPSAGDRSSELPLAKDALLLDSIQTLCKKKSYLDLTVKPGWIYYPTNLSQIFQLNKIFAPSGQNFIDDVLFEQHKVFIEILPKKVETLLHFTYSTNSQYSINQSNYFETKAYVRSSKNRFLRHNPFCKGQSCCFFIRPVYYQIFPTSFKMKMFLYQSVQKQQELNFFISFNFYKNYFSEVLNLQKNSVKTVTNFPKLDIHVKELSMFSIPEGREKVLIKKLVTDCSRNVLENLPKKNHKILSLGQKINRSVESRHFLRKFYEKKDRRSLILSEKQWRKPDISLQSEYFSNSIFSYIQLNICLSKITTSSETVFSELSFHRSTFKPWSSTPDIMHTVSLNGKSVRIEKDLLLNTFKFEKGLKESNSRLSYFDALPFFEYSGFSPYAFLANQRLLASAFSKEETEVLNNHFRFGEHSVKSNSYTNSFLKLPLSMNVLLLNIQNNSFGQIIGLTNFGSPFEGEILRDPSDKLTVTNVEKTVNVYLEKALKNQHQSQKLILTKSDIFSLKFPSIFPESNFRPLVESLDQNRTSSLFFDKQRTKTIFKFLLDKYSKFTKLEENSLQRFNSPNYKLLDFQTNYKHKTYRLNALTMEFLSETKKLRLGHFIQPGEKLYSNVSLLNSGQIIHLSSIFLTLRKAEFFSVSPKAILHTYNGNYLEKNLPVMTLPFETLKTGDIVQGIPKVEQYLEARTTIKGRLFLNSLPVLLQAIYQRYSGYFNMENAVRQSFLKIQQILVDGVQRVYRSQGVSIADKHLEIIVRQMTSKVRIVHGGQTGFFSGELVDLEFVERLNRFLKVKIRYEPVVLGITRASLEVDSFLSAASFQQTTKVLTRAAVENRRDFLKGLKESLLVGNLLPAGTGYVLPIQKLN
jgi:hypothetical protein